MKTKQEIEKLAEQYTQDGIYLSDSEKQQTEIAYMTGYTQCQEDIGKELEALRAAIRKNTWYDIDGNAQVNLYGIDNNLLNKQD